MFGGIPSEYIDALNKVGNDLKYKLDCLNFIKDSVENEISFEKIQRHGLKGLYIFLWSLLKETNNKLILIILQTIDQLLQSLNKKYYYKVNFSLLLPHLINKLNDCCQQGFNETLFNNNHLIKKEVISILQRFKQIEGEEEFDKTIMRMVAPSAYEFFKSI